MGPVLGPGSTGKTEEMKTVREWLNELPELIRSRAIRNAEDYHKPFLDESEIRLRQAVSGAFIWHETPEGYEFWNAVAMGETPELPDHLKDEE